MQETKQSTIEATLEQIHTDTIKQLEDQLVASIKERDQLAINLQGLREQSQAAIHSNDLANDKNELLDLELQRLEEYSS